MTPEERQQIVERDKRVVWHPYTPMGQYRESANPLVIERASGCRLFDVDGRSIIDGNASWWTALLGHNHPRLVAALTQQAERLCHTSLGGVTHEPAIRFAEALAEVAPKGLKHVFFSDNGSTAVEAALKLAVQYYGQRSAASKKKTKFISLQDAFHGETMGVTALGGVEAFRAPFTDLVMPCVHLPSPADGEARSLEVLEETLRNEGEKVAAFVVEPLIQGAGGMRMYSPSYLKEARRLTSAYDVLFIVDEVFTGYGRTAKFWACDHADVSPDIVCSAKGLSGGLLPFAATLVSDEIYEGFLGDASRAFYYGHTYCGNPLGSAVAAEVLSVYRDEEILAGAERRASLIRDAFERMGKLEGVVGARSLGVCGALNLVGGRGYLERGGWEVYERALRRGAYVRPLGNVVYVTPPLNIPEEDLMELLSIVQESVAEVVEAKAKA
jgi:adenosylmethionine-8-amino-7-oxononanoate aminotransferase